MIILGATVHTVLPTAQVYMRRALKMIEIIGISRRRFSFALIFSDFINLATVCKLISNYEFN